MMYACAVVTVALAVGECAARAWLYWIAPRSAYPLYAIASEFPEAAKYAPHHYCCYRLQPGYERGGTHHNSLGYRGREITAAKPEGVYRIAVLGGSTTYGEFIDKDEETFPAQLEAKLRREGFDRVEVVNAGVPGYNSWESLVDLEFRVLDLKPDLVIVYYGINDVHCRLVSPEAYRSDNSGRRTTWREPPEVRWCRYSVLSRIVGHRLGLWRNPGVDSYVQAGTSDPGVHGESRAIGCDPMAALDKNGTEFFERNLRTTAAVSRAAGARVMLATWACSPAIGDYTATPHYQRGIRELNEVVRKVGGEMDVSFYDFAAEMPVDVKYWRDGRHVNEAGAELQGKRFAEFIEAHGVIGKDADEWKVESARSLREDKGERGGDWSTIELKEFGLVGNRWSIDLSKRAVLTLTGRSGENEVAQLGVHQAAVESASIARACN